MKYAVPIVLGAQPLDPVGELRGEGQVIGISDTGLDTNSPFFTDRTAPVPFCTTDCVVGTHRKIVSYRHFSWSDSTDTPGGHGTSVCSAAVGSATGNGFNGVAPNARIAFEDLSTNGDNIVAPSDLTLNLFAHAYEMGARVYSISWGSQHNDYDLWALELDQFAYAHPDFLLHVAVGNNGPLDGTLSSPATAKNALSVGATMNGAKVFGAR